MGRHDAARPEWDGLACVCTAVCTMGTFILTSCRFVLISHDTAWPHPRQAPLHALHPTHHCPLLPHTLHTQPLSMGRNLFCVHSKKHLMDVPEQKAKKMETNRKTLAAMQQRLSEGGALIWVAPSGGRDRPRPDGLLLPDLFDPTVVGLMRNLVARANKPGHLIPMAMYSHPLMPPPNAVAHGGIGEKALTETRLCSYSPVGISLCEDLDVDDVSAVHACLSTLCCAHMHMLLYRLLAGLHLAVHFCLL